MNTAFHTVALALTVCAGMAACGGADSAPPVDLVPAALAAPAQMPIESVRSAVPASMGTHLAETATTSVPTSGPVRMLPDPWEVVP